MSLDTVLKIGKAFRESDNGLKYFEYIKPCPKDTDKDSVIRLSIPIKEDFSFDFDKITEITNQNVIGSETKDTKLYYLTFKTSASDGMVKYIFGDILYTQTSKLKNDKVDFSEGGYFRLDNDKAKGAYKLNSFERGKNDFKEIINLIDSEKKNESILMKFHSSFENNFVNIHRILKYQVGFFKYLRLQKKDFSIEEFLKQEQLLIEFNALGNFDNIKKNKNGKKILNAIFNTQEVDYEWENFENDKESLIVLSNYTNSQLFLHFDFNNIENWYNYKDELALITEKMLDDFVSKSGNKYVLKKTLYKTLCSGDQKNDIQFPQFEINSKYKSKYFSLDEINNLFYAIDYSKKAVLSPTDDIKLIVLPNGDNLTANDYEEFQMNSSTLVAETIVNRKNTDTNNTDDILLSWYDESYLNQNPITHFDLIFSKKGAGVGTPDIDLIELSGVSKSSLQFLRERHREITNEIIEKRKKEIASDKLISPSINWSFTQILGSPQESNGKVQFKTNPKYQTHLLKILPQIYSGNYINDNILLPSFISNIEYSIRHGDSKYKLLKYDLEFILSIQNTAIYKNNYMKIIESESYQIGLLLGKLSQNFAGENSPIKSFEKNYVGNLTRKIPTLKDFIEFKNDVEQKLIMHEKNKFTFKISSELSEKIKNFEGVYDKQESAFGFFESYYSSFKSSNQIVENL